MKDNKDQKARIFKIDPLTTYISFADIDSVYEKEIYTGNKILKGLKQEGRMLYYQYEKYKSDLNTIRVNMPNIG
jgi:hypothetical protein